MVHLQSPMLARARHPVRAALLITLAIAPWQLAHGADNGSTPPMPEDFSLAAVGDLLGYDKPLLAIGDPSFKEVIKLIQGADAGFLNLEGAIFDRNTFNGSRGAENGGGYPLHEAEVAPELASIGFRLASLANNHGGDWGIEGQVESRKVLDAAGLVHAGTGTSLEEARAAAYLHLPKSTVAFLATASTYTPMSVAGHGGEHLNPRPGMSALRNQPVTLVSESEMRTLRAIAERRDNLVPLTNPTQISIAEGAVYRVSDKVGVTYDLNPSDRKEIVDAVRDGKRHANFAVFSIHAHETALGDGDDQRPGDFLAPLFHDVVDAGADVVVRHGPHTLNGIEIYHGRVILYGMGSFFFDVGGPKHSITIPGNGTDAQHLELHFPDAWYDSAIAISHFHRGQLKEVRIYPLTMQSTPGPMFGAPQRAVPADAKRILEKLQHDSMQFGTIIRIEAGIGVIRPTA